MNTIKKLRKESGLKQQDLAEKLSISRSTVAMWETGKAQPDNETLLKLSSIFNSSIDYILNNDCFSPPASFGERLKELRKEHKLSQEDLGEILYLSKGAVGNWELGTRQPDYDTLKFLAEYFNVSTDYLLGKDATTEHTSTTPSIFGERLKTLRLEKGLSQEELALKLGLSKANVSKYESGNIEPNFTTLKSIASIFNVSIDYLLGNEMLSAPQFSENEQYLIDKFRKLPWKSQNHILQTADILSEK